LAEEKPTHVKEKAVPEKKVAKPAIAEKKKAAPKKKTITEVSAAKEKAVAKKKSTNKKVTKTEVKEAVSEKKAAKPEVAPAKEEKAAEKKVSKPEAPAKAEKPEAEEKVEPKVVKKPKTEWTGNPMLKPRIEKVTVNMSVGKSGAPLEQAVKILQQLTGQKPSKRQAKKTVREFGIRKGESIACLVTLRKEKADAFLRKAFYAIDKKLSKYCFDRQGNFSFGIKEHIDIPGTKYVPELGIHGMDVSVSLGRAGYRVKRRHRIRADLGKDHLLKPEEAIQFIKDEFDVEIA
jgi:large subunit ribosomal protein L5